MRDTNRIEPFLDKFKELWLECPDLRFGQLVYIISAHTGMGIFNIEEDKYLEQIEKELKWRDCR